ncbi:uncharacterized protein I303_107082 [Kwoniella dejecticola CBS 10117]|uniref:Uncharacterized protein n=1 Tax=Kwoniella dejecticola CBS 10117 TaxID=1296121 RepID=A0A1A5ZYN8_9TREE|nr:uncharacterized protein I303_06483 [Kwoniella dejecticola CBS 10117]OBR82925.1 hypothetical protein I303_06483 [Kwoniella dejecticola CBS 10117]
MTSDLPDNFDIPDECAVSDEEETYEHDILEKHPEKWTTLLKSPKGSTSSSDTSKSQKPHRQSRLNRAQKAINSIYDEIAGPEVDYTHTHTHTQSSSPRTSDRSTKVKQGLYHITADRKQRNRYTSPNSQGYRASEQGRWDNYIYSSPSKTVYERSREPVGLIFSRGDLFRSDHCSRSSRNSSLTGSPSAMDSAFDLARHHTNVNASRVSSSEGYPDNFRKVSGADEERCKHVRRMEELERQVDYEMRGVDDYHERGW